MTIPRLCVNHSFISQGTKSRQINKVQRQKGWRQSASEQRSGIVRKNASKKSSDHEKRNTLVESTDFSAWKEAASVSRDKRQRRVCSGESGCNHPTDVRMKRQSVHHKVASS